MKVLYFHQHFTIPTQAGGTRSYELAKRLVERGHSVCMVCGETAKLDLPQHSNEKCAQRDGRWIDSDTNSFALFE